MPNPQESFLGEVFRDAAILHDALYQPKYHSAIAVVQLGQCLRIPLAHTSDQIGAALRQYRENNGDDCQCRLKQAGSRHSCAFPGFAANAINGSLSPAKASISGVWPV
jgi:hypothetical protein